MAKRMFNLGSDTGGDASRRRAFGGIAGAAALGLLALLPRTSVATQVPPQSDGSSWPGKLKRGHRQVVDAYEINNGHPLSFAYTFVAPNLASGDEATSVVVLRHMALPLALNDAMWSKYKVGKSLKIVDPATKLPAVHNPYLRPKPGVLVVDDMAIHRLLEQGTLFGACHIALRSLSKKLAANAGVSADYAASEWEANVVPRITLIPSGAWAINRAQEAGCTYCTGGG
jgi:hypothetical protein